MAGLMANGTPNGRPMGRAVDLGRRKTLATMTDDEARRVQEMLEHKLLARCNGCGRRITIGFKFTSIDPRQEKPVVQLAACTREDCDFAERCRDGAVLMEMVEFAWIDENGADAPASLQVQERNARLAAQEAEKPTDD